MPLTNPIGGSAKRTTLHSAGVSASSTLHVVATTLDGETRAARPHCQCLTRFATSEFLQAWRQNWYTVSLEFRSQINNFYFWYTKCYDSWCDFSVGGAA